MNIKGRDATIDIAKGIGMIAVVLGHTTFTGKNFLYQFHLPLFFFLSGLVWNEKKINNIPKYFFGKIKGFYVPFILFELVFLLLHNVFSEMGFYSVKSRVDLYYSLQMTIQRGLKILIMGAGEQLAGPLWFLISSLEIVIIFPIIYWLVNLIFKKERAREVAILLIVMLLFFVGCYTNLPRMLSQAFIGIFFFGSGFVYRRYRDRIKLNIWGALICTIVILACGCINEVDISKLRITYKPLLILSGLAGSYFSLYIGTILDNSKQKVFSFVGNSLQYIGSNTISILALHCISFKLVMLLEWRITNYDFELLGVFPYYSESKWIIPLAVLAGILIPIALCFISEKTVIYFHGHFKRGRIYEQN